MPTRVASCNLLTSVTLPLTMDRCGPERNEMTDPDDRKSFYQQTNILGESYDPMMEARHSEIPTFMRAPFVTDLSQVDIGIIGIP